MGHGFFRDFIKHATRTRYSKCEGVQGGLTYDFPQAVPLTD